MTLAQRGSSPTASKAIADTLPKPQTPGQAVAVAILGLILLAIIFALVIRFVRGRD